jgi:general secretion pathway protein H
MRARGFTLVELVVVVALIAAALAMAASLFSAGLPGQQLRGTARELAAQLRYTRAQALVTGRPQSFLLDTRTRDWQAPNHHAGRVPAKIEIVATVASSERPSPQVAAIRFFPEGAATGGRIVLKRNAAAWQVDVDWLTGEVSVARAETP